MNRKNIFFVLVCVLIPSTVFSMDKEVRDYPDEVYDYNSDNDDHVVRQPEPGPVVYVDPNANDAPAPAPARNYDVSVAIQWGHARQLRGNNDETFAPRGQQNGMFSRNVTHGTSFLVLARSCFSFLMPYHVIDHEYEKKNGQKVKYRVALPSDLQRSVRVDAMGTRFVYPFIEDQQQGKYWVNRKAQHKIQDIQNSYDANTRGLEWSRFAFMKRARVMYRTWIGKNKLAFVLHYPYVASGIKYGVLGSGIYYLYTKLFASHEDGLNDFDFEDEGHE